MIIQDKDNNGNNNGEDFWTQEAGSHYLMENYSSNFSDPLAVPVIVSTRNEEECMESNFESQSCETFTLNTGITTRLSHTENFSSQDLEGWW